MKRNYFFTLLLVLASLGANAQYADSLCNASFEDTLRNWVSFSNGGGVTDFGYTTTDVNDGALAAKITVTDPGTGTILRSCTGDMEAGIVYRISFWAKSDEGNISVRATSSLQVSPFTNYGTADFIFASTWTKYSFTSQSEVDVIGEAILAKFKFLEAGTYYLDKVEVEKLDALSEICDGDFENGISAWDITSKDGAVAGLNPETTEVHGGSGSVKVEVLTAGTQASSVMLASCKSDVQMDVQYTLEFWAKADASVSINAQSVLSVSPFTAYANEAFTIGTTWEKHSYSFTGTEDVDGNVRLIRFQFPNVGAVYIDDVTITETPVSGLFNNAKIGSLEVYPVPALDVVNVSLERGHDASAYQLISSTGKVLSAEELNSVQEFSIDVATEYSGIAVLKVITDQGILTSKVVLK